MRATLDDIARAAEGRLVAGRAASPRAVERVTTDSRAISPGCLFVALRGDRFDGHDFVPAALRAGAAAALVSRRPEGLENGHALVLVDDTLAAYQRLAAWWRAQVQATVVGVTGSNGKSTTREMLALLLGALGPAMCSEANHNNHIGVPQTLLRIRPEHRFAVVEMGVNHFGEMAPLASCARPNIGLITNIAAAHVEAFGDESGVAREKAVMLDYLAPGGLAVLCADEPWSRGIAERHQGRKVTFGLAREADWRATGIREANGGVRFRVAYRSAGHGRFAGPCEVRVPAPGRWQVLNGLAAIAAAAELGLSLSLAAERLAGFVPLSLRMNVRRVGGMTVLMDCYNANPASMLCAVGELGRRRGRRVAVLGDMLELGQASEAAHRRVGAAVAAARIGLLCALGNQAAAIAREAIEGGLDPANVLSTAEPGEAIAWLRPRLRPRDTVLFKASRGMRLEQVAQAVLEEPSAGGNGR